MSKPVVLSALLLAVAVAIPSIAAPIGSLTGLNRSILELAQTQDPAQQLYQIYSDSSFAQSSKEMEVLIARLEALFKASPEMRTTRVRGQGDLTGDQLLANFTANLEKLRVAEYDLSVRRLLEQAANEIYAPMNNPQYWLETSRQSEEVIEQELKRLVRSSVEIVTFLKQYFEENPSAVTTEISLVADRTATGAQLLTTSQNNVTRNSQALKTFYAGRMARVKSETSDLNKSANPYLTLERARKEAASKQLAVLRNAGYSYQEAINGFGGVVNRFKSWVEEAPEFAAESVQFAGKTQSVKSHIAALTATLKTAQAENNAFQPKWKAARAEFDRQTSAELKKLLAGDRKAIFAARGWPLRSANASDTWTPIQIVQNLVKAPYWSYYFRNANDVYCSYTYYFQGNKLIRSEKSPEAFC